MTAATDAILYLAGDEVVAACREIDAVAAMREVLRLHAGGDALLPAEAYLAWRTPSGAPARSLNMPCALGADLLRPGTKIINASLSNVERGLPRASGVVLLFDAETARVVCVMEAAHLSATRTAGVTVVAAEELGVPPLRHVAVIGAGALGAAHAGLLADRLPGLERIEVFDVVAERAERLCAALAPAASGRGVALRATLSAKEAVDGAGLVVTATTVTSGYLEHGWLAPGALVVNVSLDDLLPEVVLRADHLIVDDWPLVRDDPYRLLGRLYREGAVVGPGEHAAPGSARAVDATLGEVVSGGYRRERSPSDLVLVNPFGMAIEDIMLAHHVYEIARRRGLGQELPR